MWIARVCAFLGAELNMDYRDVMQMPMSGIAYMLCAARERRGEKIMHRRTSQQSAAILEFMEQQMSKQNA